MASAIFLTAFLAVSSHSANGALLREVSSRIPGATLADLTNNARFQSQPDLTNTVTTIESPPDVGDDYGVRLSGFVVPNVSGSYKFHLSVNGQAALFLGFDEHPEYKRLIALPSRWATGRGNGWPDEIRLRAALHRKTFLRSSALSPGKPTMWKRS